MEGSMIFGSSRFRIWLWIGFAVLPLAAMGQRGSTGNTNTNSRTPAPTTRPNATPDAIIQPVFVSGKVLLENGGPLPETVAIERICNGVIRREGYTDFKGQFEFQLGINVGFQDASENDSRLTPNAFPRPGSNAGRRPLDLTGCEFRAVLAGYTSSITMLRTSGDTWQFDVGTIFLKRMGDARGSTISVTSMAAPKDAMRAYEKAQKLKESKPDEAEKELSKAVQIYPQFATAWSLLGDMHRRRSDFDDARTEYNQAIAADSQFVNPTYGLAMIAMQEKKWDEAARLTDQVIKLNSSAFPLVYFFSAAANYNSQRFDAAEESGRRFKALDTQHSHPDVFLLLSYVLARKKDYAGAARELRDYLAAVPDAPDAEAVKIEAKRFEDLSVSAAKQE
jgi:Tfp pilus assembly protein PilF